MAKIMKAMKTRSSSTKSAKASNKAVTTRCKLIAAGLQSHACGKMLAKTLVDTVGVRKAKRHANQESIAAMVKQALESIGQKAEGEVAALSAKVAAAEPERLSREAALDAAKTAVKERAEAAVTAKSVLKEATEAEKAAVAAKEHAEEEQKNFDKCFAESSTKKERLDAFEGEWASLKVHAGEDSSLVKTALASLRSVEKFIAMEKTMLDSLPGALKKVPTARGSFDDFIIKSAEDEIKKTQHSLAAAVAAGEQEKQACLAKVEAATTALTSAAERVAACNTALGEAGGAATASKATLEAAKKAVESHTHETKDVNEALKKATEKLASHMKRPVKAFKELENVTDESPGFVFETIDGVKCDTAIVNVCRNAAAKGGGTISADDAKVFLSKIKEEVEHSGWAGAVVGRWSIRYCLTEFAWAEAAHDVVVEINKEIPREPEKKKGKTSGYYIQVDGVKCDSRMIQKCFAAVSGEGDGRVSVDDAKTVFAAMADGGKQTLCEKWTLRYCLMEYKWTQAAKAWLTEARANLPTAE